MISKKIKAAGLALAVASSTAFGAEQVETPEKMDEGVYSSLTRLMSVMQIVHQNYVSKDSADYQRLINGALKGMLKELDPYSDYYEPGIFQDIEDETAGEFGGIGVVVSVCNDGLEVVKVNKNGPAQKAGALPGDIITHIDAKQINKMSIRDCTALLKGEPGTAVDIRIDRATSLAPINILVHREIIKVSPITAAVMATPEIGYIHLANFSRPTAEKLDEAIDSLQSKKMKALIFDLRNNPGGFIDSAADVCSRFIKKGKKVVFTKGRRKEDVHTLYAKKASNKLLDIPMVILVNEMSASASEIVAGCLKDYGRAQLIGEKTYGKGSVQTVIGLDNKGGIKFTIAKYYTPNDYVIHEKGIKPDIKVAMTNSSHLNTQIEEYPGIVNPEKEGTIEDTQLKRAIAELSTQLTSLRASR